MSASWPWTSSHLPTRWSSSFLSDAVISATSSSVPRRRSSSTSIVLDLAEGAGPRAQGRGRRAEGAGKFSKPDKRRYYLIAVGSTTESAASLDVCLRLKLVPPELHSDGKARLERIAAMLVRLAKAQEA